MKAPLGWKDTVTKTTVHEEFWRIWKKCGYNLPTNTNVSYTWVMISEKHRQVVGYGVNGGDGPSHDTLVLVGAFHLGHLVQLDPVAVAVSHLKDVMTDV